MRKLHLLFGVVMLFIAHITPAQQKPVDSIAFFIDEHPIEVKISTDVRNLLNKRTKREYQPADITMRFPDSTAISEQIRIQTRGVYRLNNCYMPSSMLLLNALKPNFSTFLITIKYVSILFLCFIPLQAIIYHSVKDIKARCDEDRGQKSHLTWDARGKLN